MKKFTKILALILALVMSVSFLAVSAAADDTTDDTNGEGEEQEVIKVDNWFKFIVAFFARLIDLLFGLFD